MITHYSCNGISSEIKHFYFPGIQKENEVFEDILFRMITQLDGELFNSRRSFAQQIKNLV